MRKLTFLQSSKALVSHKDDADVPARTRLEPFNPPPEDVRLGAEEVARIGITMLTWGAIAMAVSCGILHLLELCF